MKDVIPLREMPLKQVRRIWNESFSGRFPKVRVCFLSDKDFDLFAYDGLSKRLQRFNELHRKEEHGSEYSWAKHSANGYVRFESDGSYLICIRDKLKILDEDGSIRDRKPGDVSEELMLRIIVKHELNHVKRGDPERVSRDYKNFSQGESR